ncbi:MAG: DUF11 domain-containing protein [Actinomycetota bacterium]|nr:DUF11 domain-containing protein [Actinomycetota bacterium]
MSVFMQISRARSTLIAISAVLALVSPVTSIAVAQSPPNPPPPAPQPTGDNPQSLADGCQRDAAAILAQQTPEWVYVYNTPPDQPPPPPQWMSGVVDSYNHRFEAVHTAGADFPFGHDAYDFIINVVPDPEYRFLMAGNDGSDGNPKTGNYPGNGEETARMHTEWEDLTVPYFVWPEPGNRVTMKGSWTWDCGHWGTPTTIFSPDYFLPQVGQPCPLMPPAPEPISDPDQCDPTGERTEFHPSRAIFVERQQQPDSDFPVEPNNPPGTNPYSALGNNPNSPFGENEGDVFVSTDKTRAGKHVDCAHKHPPPTRTVAYPPEFNACVNVLEPNWQDVSGHYEFVLKAPPKPTPDAHLTFRAERQPESTANAPAPTLTPTAAGDGVRISFDLTSPENVRLVLGYKIFVGWDVLPPEQVPTHLRVTFDELKIHRAMDPGCELGAPAPGCQDQSTRTNQETKAPGDYNIYWDVNGIWGYWPCDDSKVDPPECGRLRPHPMDAGNPEPAPGELLVNDGESREGTQSVDLYVPPGKGWRLFVHGRECDINAVDPSHPFRDCPTNEELADNNDVPGLIEDVYPSAEASLGTHTSHALTRSGDPTSTCPDTNPQGCYSVTYTVTEVDDAASRVRLPKADLSLTKNDSPDPAYVGRRLTYTLEVQNNGPHSAAGVELIDSLPKSVRFRRTTFSQGSCTYASRTHAVNCAIGTIEDGATATVRVIVKPTRKGPATNRASVSATSPEDPNTANNTAAERTRVRPPPDD